MRDYISRHGLAIAAFGLFVLFWIGQSIAGFLVFNSEQQEHGLAIISYLAYLATGHFWEATAENWESEYLQMGLYVLLTAFLSQQGSAESKTPEQKQQEIAEEQQGAGKGPVPWPIRRGGIARTFYENSLSIVLLSMFLLSFVIHVIAGAAEYNWEQAQLGQPPITPLAFLRVPQLWMQSLENWQSEFLAVGSMVVLSIYLRQKGSSQSNNVAAPSSQTGE